MQAVVQRVTRASVDVGGRTVAAIEDGLLILLGVEKGDGEDQAGHLASKIARMRIFGDDNGKMNLSVAEIGGQVLVVPQFTLAADVKKGRRPSFDTAAEPSRAQQLFEVFTRAMAGEGVNTAIGAFQKHMHVSLVNDGPVTFVVEG